MCWWIVADCGGCGWIRRIQITWRNIRGLCVGMVLRIAIVITILLVGQPSVHRSLKTDPGLSCPRTSPLASWRSSSPRHLSYLPNEASARYLFHFLSSSLSFSLPLYLFVLCFGRSRRRPVVRQHHHSNIRETFQCFFIYRFGQSYGNCATGSNELNTINNWSIDCFFLFLISSPIEIIFLYIICDFTKKIKHPFSCERKLEWELILSLEIMNIIL